MQNQTHENPRTKYLLTYKKLIFIFPTLAAVIALGYFMALKYDFDTSIGHFERGSVWFYVFSAGIILSVILAAVLSKMSIGKLSITEVPKSNAATVFGAVLVAILSLGLLVSSATDLSFGLLGTFGKYSAYLLPFISISFILSLFDKFKSGTIRLICTSLAAISITLTMFEMYFDFSVPLNSPVRNLSTIANSAVMLFFFSEARLTLKADSRRITPEFYIFANASAAALSFGITVGALISKLLTPTADDPNMPLIRLALYAAISLIALSRLFDLKKITSDYVKKEEKNVSPALESAEDTAPDVINDTDNSENNNSENNNFSDIQ